MKWVRYQDLNGLKWQLQKQVKVSQAIIDLALVKIAWALANNQKIKSSLNKDKIFYYAAKGEETPDLN